MKNKTKSSKNSKSKSSKKTKKNRINTFFGYFILLFASAAPVGLIISAISIWVPNRFFFLSNVLGILFPFLCIFSLFFALLYLSLRKKRCLFFFIAILLNIQNIRSYVVFRHEQEPKSEDSFRLLSYNVNLFDYYQHRGVDRGDIKSDIIQLLEDQSPDFICFQEYYESINADFSVRSEFFKNKYPYISTPSANKRFYYGNAIYSKYPILKTGNIDTLSPIYGHYADILYKKDTFRIYNIHLESYKFDKHDREAYIEALSGDPENHINKNTYLKIIAKVRQSSSARAEQMSIIKKHIKSSPYKNLICGDFNEQPISYVYREMTQELEDAFIKKGRGTGRTYEGIFPAYRIDYILYSKALHALSFQILKNSYSDHFAIMSDFQIKN